MLFNIPLAIWLGILTIASLFITLSLGIALYNLRKNVFRYHRIFAFLTAALAITHAISATLLYFYGITL